MARLDHLGEGHSGRRDETSLIHRTGLIELEAKTHASKFVLAAVSWE